MQFIPNTETYSPPPTVPTPPKATREPVRFILVGAEMDIDLVVKTLHQLGFAEPRSWSKPQIDPISGKPMRILTKWIRR